MKILLVNNDRKWGGGQEHLKDLAAGLTVRGFEPHFLCRNGSPSECNFRGLGYHVTAAAGTGGGFINEVFRTARLLKNESFRLVMVAREHDLHRIAIARMIIPAARRGRLLASYHTATSRKQFMLDSADAVVCVSKYILDRLLMKNPSVASRVTVINNGIDASVEISNEKFLPLRHRRFFKTAGEPLIGAVGALYKNQIELIEALAMLKKEFPQLTLALIGDDDNPDLVAPLKDKARRMNVEKQVLFTGHLNKKQLADVYFDLDVSVSAFRNEGFGLVHLESLAAGTPVVTYAEGGQVDIFQSGNAGLLVEGGTVQFAEAIASLLRNSELRISMGRNGVLLVRDKFSLARMADDYMNLFNKLINQD